LTLLGTLSCSATLGSALEDISNTVEATSIPFVHWAVCRLSDHGRLADVAVQTCCHLGPFWEPQVPVFDRNG
jgi:hypothetical protein